MTNTDHEGELMRRLFGGRWSDDDARFPNLDPDVQAAYLAVVNVIARVRDESAVVPGEAPA